MLRILVVLLHVFFSLPVVNWVWQKVLDVWQVNNRIPEGTSFDAGVITSYAATESRLTHGSRVVLERAVSLAGTKTLLFWGSFGPSNSNQEEKLKRLGLITFPHAFFGKVTSAEDETDACLQKMSQIFSECGESPEKIFIASEGCYSRRQELIWKRKVRKYFPKSKLYFVSVDAREAEDQENPMVFQRYWEVWLAFNIFFWVVYHVPFAHWIVKRLNPRQPTS